MHERLREHALALPRSGLLVVLKLCQVLKSLAILLSLLLLCFGLWFPFVPAVLSARRTAAAHRGAARRWSGVEIPEPYEPRPPAIEPQEDGRFKHGARLYRRRWWPQFLDNTTWLNRDRATARDTLWMLVDPFVGLPLVLIGPVLVLGGASALALPFFDLPIPPAVEVAGGVVAIAAGLALGPPLLRAHARWTRVLLAPESARAAVRSQRRIRWFITRGYALARPLLLLGQSIGNLVVGLATLLGVVLTGVAATPLLRAVRPLADLHRTQAYRWSGVHVPSPYRPPPEPPAQREDGMYEYGHRLYRTPTVPALRLRARGALRDPATWRDLGFLLVSPLLAAIPVLGTALFVIGIFGIAWPLPWRDHWAWGLTPWVAIPLGYAIALLAAAVSVPLMRAHAACASALLGPTAAEREEQRTRAITETRPESTWAESTELRRVERDLHDGAQARLVAIGMALSNIEFLIDSDPDQAKALAASTRAASVTALGELRSLVRSIHPPVLSERGLGDALKALALDLPLTTHVTVDLPGSLEPPVESAAYFAGAELLSNAIRHGDADETWIDLRHERGALTLSVLDDGRGGADPSRGTGLTGIQRRIAVFDGTLQVTSPAGGPTKAVIGIPCALLPPR
ncbi:sensor domain-containing protein [Actinokineospora sp. G85]|uniref:sensor histidine kinase n=1 Tax=Actinokineospora sp. G85 TaxID=3406626 RepID=UPI003C76E3D1